MCLLWRIAWSKCTYIAIWSVYNVEDGISFNRVLVGTRNNPLPRGELEMVGTDAIIEMFWAQMT